MVIAIHGLFSQRFCKVLLSLASVGIAISKVTSDVMPLMHILSSVVALQILSYSYRRTVRLGGIPVVHSVPGVLQWPGGRAVRCPAPGQQTEVSTQSSISGDTWTGWGMKPKNSHSIDFDKNYKELN